MQTSCPSCGAEIFPGARFCRRCGASLHATGGETGDVSPNAATVPLAPDVPRNTDGLAPDDEERIAPQTSRVSLAEMERLLRAQDGGGQPDSHQADPEAKLVSHTPAVTRPDLPDYDEELTITVPRTAQTSETGDFEMTADFDATHLADPEATLPAKAVGSWPYSVEPNEPEAPADGANAEASDDANVSANAPADEGANANSDGGASVTAAGGASVTAAAGNVAPSSNVVPAALPPNAPAPGVRQPRRAWPLVVAVCVAVAFVLSGGAWLAYKLLHRPAITEVPTQGPTAPTGTDANAQFEQKLGEAEALLVGGDIEGALNRLREANGLDPANTRAHRRLAELLLSTGARREAIEELRAVTRNAPEDFDAWRQLATAQYAEGLYNDAAESYRRVLNLSATGGAQPDPHDVLAWADALRLAGRAEEAHAAYQQLTTSADAEVAGVARQRLAEFARAAASPTPASTPRPGEQPVPRAEETASVNVPSTPQPTPAPTSTPQPTPTPAPTPAASSGDRYERGVKLWSANRGAALEEFRAAAAGGSLDAHYYLGLAYVEGRKLGSLQRAEVVAALQHFQLAGRGNQHASQARGYAQQLEKEFDRLRRQ